jgi:hypothetical protein
MSFCAAFKKLIEDRCFYYQYSCFWYIHCISEERIWCMRTKYTRKGTRWINFYNYILVYLSIYLLNCFLVNYSVLSYKYISKPFVQQPVIFSKIKRTLISWHIRIFNIHTNFQLDQRRIFYPKLWELGVIWSNDVPNKEHSSKKTKFNNV